MCEDPQNPSVLVLNPDEYLQYLLEKCEAPESVRESEDLTANELLFLPHKDIDSLFDGCGLKPKAKFLYLIGIEKVRHLASIGIANNLSQVPVAKAVSSVDFLTEVVMGALCTTLDTTLISGCSGKAVQMDNAGRVFASDQHRKCTNCFQ
ncbi:hypothetical protein DMENIID0001_009150 [Sergentomyia squamirostris]